MTYFQDQIFPNKTLAVIVGNDPLLPVEIFEKITDYIDAHDLVDHNNANLIHADEVLAKAFGKLKFTYSELEKILEKIYRKENAKKVASLSKDIDSLIDSPSQKFIDEKRIGIEKIFEKIENLKTSLSEASVQYADSSFSNELNLLLEDFSHSAPCWNVKLTKTMTLNANRKCNMLGGPFFTCKKFPWPKSDNSYLIPLVQLDLRIVSGLRCINLGDGMLQVFIARSFSNWITRVVPRSIVESEELSTIPNMCIEEDDFNDADRWIGDDGFFHAIEDFSNARLSSFATIEDLEGFDDIPENVVKICKEINWLKDNDCNLHMFGTFNPIQYSPSKRPSCLMNLARDGEYSWGLDSTAQIFYKINKNKVDFTFEWSC